MIFANRLVTCMHTVPVLLTARLPVPEFSAVGLIAGIDRLTIMTTAIILGPIIKYYYVLFYDVT